LTVAISLDCLRSKFPKDVTTERSCSSGGYQAHAACSAEPCTLPVVPPSICLAVAFAGLCCTQQHNAPCFPDYGGTLSVSGGRLQRIPKQERGCSITLHQRSEFSHDDLLCRDACLWVYSLSTSVESNPLWAV